MRRENLKIAIVVSAMKHQSVAFKANTLLPTELHLTELDITKFVTVRKDPKPEQMVALARVLGRSPIELFPEMVT